MPESDWFARTLALPSGAQFPAIATRLARLDADGAVTLWKAWQGYVVETPGMEKDARRHAFALHLRQGVERVVSTEHRHVAWVAVGEGDPARVSASALVWELLADDTPLTDGAIRAWAGRSGAFLVVERVRAGGALLPDNARGPFILLVTE